MKKSNERRWRRIGSGLIAGLMAIALIASSLPLMETNVWWVRYLDFPRLQLSIVLVVLLLAYLAMRGHLGKFGLMLAVLAMAALGYHAAKLYRYSSFAERPAVGLEGCADGSALTIMVANVQAKNERAGDLLRLVSEVEPDLLLVMETDRWWDRHLAPLTAQYPEQVQYIPEGHGAFGMHLISKLKLVSPEFRFLFDAYTPTIVTGVELPGGEIVRFLGLHPHPPLAPAQPTTLRDAHLLTAALEARSSEMPTILAGDFNAVPWEPVTRRAMRIGRLLDPRVGRGLYPTFRADSLLMTWPLDHVLYQGEFGLLGFEVLPDIGSDHYPIVARLCQATEVASTQQVPELEDGDLSEAEISITSARALTPEA